MNTTASNLEIIAQVSSSPELSNWLQHEHISIAFTTYQTNRLILLGSNPESGLTVKEQVFDKPMGLYGNDHSLYMSTRYQIWQLDNCLVPGEIHQQSDRLYIPSRSYTTGDLNVHDLVLDATGTPLFINTDFSCLATIKSGYSFAPVWQPPFITKARGTHARVKSRIRNYRQNSLHSLHRKHLFQALSHKNMATYFVHEVLWDKGFRINTLLFL
ncbi:MAG: DUF4915 domain-containing protein [Nostocales cyanobacterium ELA583]|jgi:hypothetical protein